MAQSCAAWLQYQGLLKPPTVQLLKFVRLQVVSFQRLLLFCFEWVLGCLVEAVLQLENRVVCF